LPHLELSPDVVNFGVVWQGQPVKHDVTLKNVGSAPLEITDVSSSCGCTVPTRPKSPLAPGESSTMTISYDSARRVGPANQTVTVITNEPERTKVAIRLTGEVKALYDLQPQEGLVFGQLYRSSAEVRTVTITNKYPEPLHLSLPEQPDVGPFTLELKEVEPGVRYALTATTKPPLKVDRFQGLVTVQTGIELVPEIRVPLYGFVQPPVSVRPSKLFLPKNSVSEMKRVLQLSYARDYPVEIVSVQAMPASIKAVAEKAEPGPDGKPVDTYKVTVTLPPGEMIPAGVEPTIEITTSAKDPEYQHLEVPVHIVYPPSTSQPAAATTTSGGPT
jgi:hypothetical protein